MFPNGSFKSQSFHSFSVNEELKDNDQDSNIKFCQTQFYSLDTSYHISNEAKENLQNYKKKLFSVLQLKIRSMIKNVELFHGLLKSLHFLRGFYTRRNLRSTLDDF